MNKLAMFLGATALTLSVQAQAAFVSGAAVVDDLVVTTTGDASFSFTAPEWFIADAFVNDGTPFYDADSYADGIPGAALITSTVGGATTTAEAEAGTSSYSLTVADGAGSADASTLSEMDFVIDGTGSITLEFAFTLDSEISGATGTESVENSVFAYDSFGGSDDAFSFESGDLGDVLISESFFLTLVIEADGLDFGTLTVETASISATGIDPSPVPVPAALWLLGSALIGFVGFARRS